MNAKNLKSKTILADKPYIILTFYEIKMTIVVDSTLNKLHLTKL
jgi:hypothetical protein